MSIAFRRRALTKMQGVIIASIVVIAAVAASVGYYLTIPRSDEWADTLICGTTWLMTNADPHVGVTTGLNHNIAPAISDSLFWQAYDDATIRGALAETFEVRYETINGTQRPYLWVKMREGLHRNDGSEIVAEDFAFSWRRLLMPGVCPEQTGVAQWGFAYDDFGNDTWVALSKYELKIRLTTSFPMVAILLSGYAIITPPVINKATADKYPIGSMEIAKYGCSGPLIETEVVPQDHVTLMVREDYTNPNTGGWVAGMGKADEGWPPRWKKLIIRSYGSPSALALALKSGEIDVALGDLQTTDITSFQDDPDMIVLEQASGINRFLTLNYAFPPLDNIKVRQAIAYALDFNENVEKVKKGAAQVAQSIVHSYYPYFIPAFKDRYKSEKPRDLDKARALMAEAGYANGFTTTMIIAGHYAPIDEERNDALIIQDQLADINITLNIEQVDSSTWKAKKSEGSIPIFMGGFYPDFPDPENDIETITMHGNQFNFYDALSNQTAYPEATYHYQEFLDLVEQGMDLWDPTISFAANTARKENFEKQQEIIAEQVYHLPAYFGKGFLVARSYVKNLKAHPIITDFMTPGILACYKERTVAASVGFSLPSIAVMLSIEIPAIMYARKLKRTRER